ncbi:MAG TPA: cyclic pyranopterin monophosphate synthase MoaC [Candidatus Dormibacteraeota bacterium]
MASRRLTHLDESGAARMVDVGGKASTPREAVAECRVRMAAETLAAVRAAAVKKGDVLGVARVAGIMAAKRTPDLIPLCHPLPISSVEVDFELEADAIRILATARVSGQTGVEMEALTAAAVAGLTVIDMVKGLEKGVWLEAVRLLSKRGGKSGDWARAAT